MKSCKRSSTWVIVFIAAWAALVIARLVHLQVFQNDTLTRQARRQQERTIEVSPVRGVIYDRNYHPLAMSVAVDSIFAVPGEIPNARATAKLLAPVLKMSEAEVARRLQAGRFFTWVKRKVSDRESRRVKQLNLQGIYTQKENKRFYPKSELAAHVLGYVGMDDRGLAGIELAYDSSIRGRPGELLIETDARQHWLGRAGKQPEAGKNVVLTLDENIQYIAERELAVAVEKFHPASATVIVQDPESGEILAMANAPTFNPNRYAQASPDALRNIAVGASYEPGSTFKVVTVGGALEEKLTNPEEPIDCQMGAILIAGHVIHDHKPYGVLTVSQIIENSSDVGAIKLALRMGDDDMYRYLRTFGFGSPTGIELPGEARGLTKPPERWSKISIGAIAMGQEVGVTSIQMVNAISAVANGGWLVRPHIVREGTRAGGAAQPGEGKRVITEQTAAELRKMMAKVVTQGTAKTAQLNGYTAAGKTGTAQKIDPRTGAYSHRDYVASFVGFAPVEAPAFTILVVVDSPRGAIYGGDVAAPVFKRVAEQILAYRNIPPGLPLQPTKPAIAKVVKTEPAAEGAALLDDVEDADTNGAAMMSLNSGVIVPDFVGKTVREVVEESQDNSVDVEMMGSGVAYQQTPAAGAAIAEGRKVRVWFRIGPVASAASDSKQADQESPAAPAASAPPSQTRLASPPSNPKPVSSATAAVPSA